MQPFDLEKAKAGHPLVTRDGRPAKFIAHVPEATYDEKVVVLIGDGIWLTDESGGVNDGPEHYKDLFMAPRKVTYWLNIYAAPYSPSCYPSKEEADRSAAEYRIGEARPVEIEL